MSLQDIMKPNNLTLYVNGVYPSAVSQSTASSTVDYVYTIGGSLNPLGLFGQINLYEGAGGNVALPGFSDIKSVVPLHNGMIFEFTVKNKGTGAMVLTNGDRVENVDTDPTVSNLDGVVNIVGPPAYTVYNTNTRIFKGVVLDASGTKEPSIQIY